MENLVAATKEELIAIIEALRARVEELEEEVRRLRQGKGGGKPLGVRPSRQRKEKKPRKRRERSFVRRREQATELRYHAVERCGDCGRKLEGGWEHRRRQVIQLELAPLRVIDHVMMGRRCGICQKRWLPELSERELGVQGKRRFGVSVQALVAMLHIRCRVPIEVVRQMLGEMFGLRISEGEVVGLLDGVRRAGEKEIAALLEEVRSSPSVCGDETGWRQDGDDGYLWTFVTPKVRYFLYRKSRSGQVPEEVLGQEFAGVVNCDFYGGYNKLGLLQRCWFHLLKDAKKLAEINADRPATVAWVEALQSLYKEAKACCVALEELPANCRARRRQRGRFERLAGALAQPYAKEPNAPEHLLAKRILKHLHELFVFISDPAVPATNNLAERSLRPAVVARKISGGTRSDKGSETKTGLMSIFGTWQLRRKPLLASCRELLLSRAPP
ncbi:MAG: IS66 family transposase [Anaerolineae bacterium]|nr:IS66 family transposase [Anaerolineae bacterium]